MAQPKPKKKPRSRSDPARREAAARRDEARRQAAEERRREQEAAERRQKTIKTARRLAVPVLAGLGVVVAAIFLFRPEKEIAGVEKVDTTAIMAGLGYVLPADIDDNASTHCPAPECGVVTELTAEQLYSDLRNGAVVLFHQPDDTATAAALAALAGGFESHVVVTSNDRLTQPVLAISWGHRRAYDSAADPGLAEFADVYRQRGRAERRLPPAGRLNRALSPERLNRGVTSADGLVSDHQRHLAPPPLAAPPPRGQASAVAACSPSSWGCVLVSAVAGLDYLTGTAVSVDLLYVLAVMAVTWVGCRRHAVLVAVLAAAEGLAGPGRHGRAWDDLTLPDVWNALTDLVVLTLVAVLLDSLHRALEHQRHLATVDSLTGALNRRAFEIAAERERLRAARHGTALSLAYLDVDHFKSANDRMGHHAGDQVLEEVAAGRHPAPCGAPTCSPGWAGTSSCCCCPRPTPARP